MRDGWERVTLGEVCGIQQGKRVEHLPVGEAPFPVLGATGVLGSWTTPSYDWPVIALGCRGTVGTVRYVAEPSWFGNNVMAVWPHDLEKLHSRFLALSLEWTDLAAAGAIGGQVQKQITRRSLEPVKIQLPSFREQERIVDLIAAVDDCVRKAESSSESLRLAGEAALRAMLAIMTGEVGKLGDVANWYSGGTPRAGDPRYYEGGSIPWAVIADVRGQRISETAKYITPDGAKKIGRIAPRGSVLLTMYGSIGRTAIAEREMATNQAIAWAEPRSGFSSEYIFAWLKLNAEQFDSLGRGATQRNINRAIVRDFPIPLLGQDEQQTFAARSREIEHALDTSRHLVQNLRAVRSNLLTALLLGEHVIPESYDEVMGVVSNVVE